MTQEEKARAYDEALEDMRVIYPNLKGDAKLAVEHAFPELAESEDENLKNKSGYYKAGKFWKASTLWNAVKDKTPQRVPNRYILQECTWNIGTLQRFADEIKNVQEVSLDYPIILDINGNILDGAHRVVKAYLEGKDIDIVYLGDDEWPEPDYDEEKAVKESEDERVRKAINILYADIDACITELLKARTDKDSEAEGKALFKMEGLMVATLQDISYIEDYLEKQKEQKPVDVDLDNASQDYVYNHFCSGADFTPDYIKGLMEDAFVDGANWQKEQKPEGGNSEKPNTQWSEEDASCLRFIKCNLEYLKREDKAYRSHDDQAELQKELNFISKVLAELAPPQLHWKLSKKDEFSDEKFLRWLRDRLVEVYKESENVSFIHRLDEIIDNVSKFHWKPSEEQMKSLLYAEGYLRRYKCSGIAKDIAKLYDDLKKL